MRYPYMLNLFVLRCHPEIPEFKKPPLTFGHLVDIALMNLPSQSVADPKWVKVVDVKRFVESSFPYYSCKMRTSNKKLVDINLRKLCGHSEQIEVTADVAQRMNFISARLMELLRTKN